MLNSFDPNKKISYGAVKDVIPQKVNVKLPESVQNYDAKEQVKESMPGSAVSGMLNTEGLKPWQLILSVAGAIGVVFGLSALVRNFVKGNGIFKAGEKLDDLYNNLKDKKIGKIASGIKGFFKKNIGDKFKSSKLGELFKKDSSGVRVGMPRPKVTMAQAQLRGSTWECSDEICDSLEQMLNPKKSKFKIIDVIREKALKIGEKIGYVKKGGIRFEGEEGLRNLIKQAGHESEADSLIEALKEYCKNSGDVELKIQTKNKFMPVLKDFFGINGEGKISEIMKNAKNTDLLQRVQLSGLSHDVDMLTTIKNMMILDGQGAKTPLGKLFQKFVLKAGEAPTNGIMSRSKIGLSLGVALYFGILNKIQKAKKGDKIATAGDETTSDIGGYMMLPLNAAVLYGMAAFKNYGLTQDAIKNYGKELKVLNQNFKEATSNIDKQAIINQFKALKKSTYGNSSLFEKIVRIPGKIMSMGLDAGPGQTKIKGIAGGAIRLLVFMIAISPLMIKPIKKLSAKIFGKSEEMREEEKKEAEKKAKKQQIKELRKAKKLNPDATIPMSQEELASKLMQHPELLQKLQNDPQFLEQVSNNPQMLMQMLNEEQTVPAQNQSVQANVPSGTKTLSPSLAQRLNNGSGTLSDNQSVINNKPVINTPQVFVNNQPVNAPLNNNIVNNAVAPVQPLEKKNDKKAEAIDTKRSYIPSSDPIKNQDASSSLTPEQKASMNRVLASADAAERSASQLLL